MVKKKRVVLLLPFNMLVIILCFLFPSFVHSKCKRQPIIFSFGDSSDTGGLAAGLGYILKYPHGRTFFHKPSGRYCDGRIMLDFLCESLNTSYLTPYMESLHANFRNGANFAVDLGDLLHPYAPFSLTLQVLQFLRFQKHSLELIGKGANNFVGDEGFKNALYMIEVGQNDMKLALTSLSYGDVVAKIPSMISEIELAMWKIHDHGGRNFWVHNIGPLGCLPQMLSSSNATDFDRHGCLQSINKGVEQFNYRLHARCEQLRLEMKNVTIVYVDFYAIKYELIAKYPSHGFENPLMACCGYGGPPYNYNQNIKCGETGYNVCKEGSRYVSWDGLHYTEAANAFVASKILSTDYSQPKLKFDYFCNT